MPFEIEKLDLDLAWRRVKSDLQTGRTFVHSPLEIELIEAARVDWLDQLREKLRIGYRPHSPLIADIPKGNGAVRPGALLSLEDRVVYSAAVGAILGSINTGLAWSQGRVDFSYRLSERLRRVDWFTNTFNSWTAFRNASLKRIEEGATYVVLTDITGFYENIDLAVLFSDLRSLGADIEIVQLLQVCLNRWCVVPNRGIPQGQSPSDVLAKVYLNAVDQVIVDMGIDYIRYVDDMRIFCSEIPACKKALMFLTHALRRRGLNLQSAKTEILSAVNAKRIIEGITPVITEVQQRYREFLEEIMGSIDPYMSISEIDQNVDPNAAPVEVVREVFRLNFLEAGAKFNRTLFHYLLNRLGAQSDEYAVEYCLGQFASKPQETQPILDYIRMTPAIPRTFEVLEEFLESPECIYDYQIYQLFNWVNSLEGFPPSVRLIAIARRISFDNARPAFLRGVCRIVLQNHGTMADLERLEGSYGAIHDEFEKAQLLVSLKRLEAGRRNAFYGRVGGDGPLCAQAVALVKEQRI
jgi:hypothetical protein